MSRARQLSAVFGVMRDGQWRTIRELRNRIINEGGPFAETQSISARLRDLRKKQFGRHTVERKPKPGTNGKVNLYRIKPGTGGGRRGQ